MSDKSKFIREQKASPEQATWTSLRQRPIKTTQDTRSKSTSQQRKSLFYFTQVSAFSSGADLVVLALESVFAAQAHGESDVDMSAKQTFPMTDESCDFNTINNMHLSYGQTLQPGKV